MRTDERVAQAAGDRIADRSWEAVKGHSPIWPSVSVHELHEKTVVAANELDQALRARDFTGWDPYDALSSPILGVFGRTPLSRRIAIQAIKRSPFNLRPLFRVPEQQHTKALALALSAYSRLARCDRSGDFTEQAAQLATRLAARELPRRVGSGWGYDFDVQTRWGFYRSGQPNAVATAFAAHALLDVASLTGEESFRDLAREGLSFALEELLVSAGNERYFAYYVGSEVAIHNASMLLASLAARSGTEHQVALAHGAVDFTIARQHQTGGWPYGEAEALRWVDGFHTAYVLWALATWNANVAVPSDEPLRRGFDFYKTHLIDPDGAARATVGRRYPVDIHAAATSVWVLSELASLSPLNASTASRVLSWTLANMRRGDSRFAFQSHRFHRNATPYVRWSDAHMLLALASFLLMEARSG